MRIRVVLFASVLLTPLSAGPLTAQHLVPDSLFRTRAPARPVLRPWGAGAGVGVGAGAMAIDQSVRNETQEERTPFRNHLSDFGNAFGNKLYVYPALALGALGGKAIGSKGLTRISWHSLEATEIGRASVEVVK